MISTVHSTDRRRVRRGLRVVALSLLCILLPASQVVLASPKAKVVCCGQLHDADHDCGCPDCPAKGSHDAGSSYAKIRGCGGASLLASPTPAPEVALLTSAIIPRSRPCAAVSATALPLVSVTSEPETPPPRG